MFFYGKKSVQNTVLTFSKLFWQNTVYRDSLSIHYLNKYDSGINVVNSRKNIHIHEIHHIFLTHK
jgi:hypothetical protein